MVSKISNLIMKMNMEVLYKIFMKTILVHIKAGFWALIWLNANNL